MSTQLERATNALFPSNGNNRVGNIKFFRGRRREITSEELAQQLNRADAQVRENHITPNQNIDGDLTT